MGFWNFGKKSDREIELANEVNELKEMLRDRERIMDSVDELLRSKEKQINELLLSNRKKSSKYEEYLETMQSKSWFAESMTVTRDNTAIVSTYNGIKGNRSKVIDIICPAGQTITMCGLIQSNIDVKEFIKNSMLYQYPHFFGIIIKDKSGNELGDDIMVDILKYYTSGMVYMITTEMYKDLSLKEGSRYKRKGERYYFKKGIELYGMEILRLTVERPDIDIASANTELIMKCDFLNYR